MALVWEYSNKNIEHVGKHMMGKFLIQYIKSASGLTTETPYRAIFRYIPGLIMYKKTLSYCI